MKPLRRLPLAEQTAAHLIDAMRSGRWEGCLPGINALAREFDVSRETVRSAVRILESNGSLLAGGPGRSRVIATEQPAKHTPHQLRVAILLYKPIAEENAEMQRNMLQLKHAIDSAGHTCIFAADCQTKLRHNVRRVARLVKETPADAWVVVGSSTEILQWFAAQPIPTIAFGGRSIGVDIASTGTDSRPALSKAIQKLASLGHRRIVMISPRHWRQPAPGRIAQAFASELATHGINSGAYNLPDWEETPEGLQALLRSLFHITPPTAILAVEPAHVVAIFAFLSQRRLRVGSDVSVVCMIADPAFTWRNPPLSHFRADTDPLIRRVVRWVEGTARGCPDRDQKSIPVEFVPGDTIGPAR